MKNSTATILIILSIGLFYTVTSPQYGALQNLQAEAEEYRKVLDGAVLISETTEEINAKYQEIPKTEIDRLNKVLPDNVDTVRLALDLDGIASKYGISIRRVEVDRIQEDNAGIIDVSGSNQPYERVGVTFTFISNYTGFVNLLGDLEKSLRITNVRDINFITTESGLYEHKVSIETYWLK